MNFSIRPALASDAKGIHTLLLKYSQQEVLLPRPLSEIYALIPQFFIAEVDDKLVGCSALEVFTSELGEVRSLAVDPQYKGYKIGEGLLTEVEGYAKNIGLSKIMALTYVDKFFHKFGYKTVMMTQLPEKVWGVCVKCPKFNNCDEVAVLKRLPQSNL